jgi:hypothetical protein
MQSHFNSKLVLPKNTRAVPLHYFPAHTSSCTSEIHFHRIGQDFAPNQRGLTDLARRLQVLVPKVCLRFPLVLCILCVLPISPPWYNHPSNIWWLAKNCNNNNNNNTKNNNHNHYWVHIFPCTPTVDRAPRTRQPFKDWNYPEHTKFSLFRSPLTGNTLSLRCKEQPVK